MEAAAKAAAEATVPKPATAMPPEAGTKGGVGKSTRYALEDHTHEVRARRKRVTLAAGTGTYAGKFVATWVFDKPFATKPIIVCTPEDDGGNPVAAAAVTASFTRDADGLWTSVVVRGWRSQPVPQTLATLLLNGVFNIFDASAAGVVVGLTAAEETPTT
ncbi:hypothetical protein [Methylorubrum extorquens]